MFACLFSSRLTTSRLVAGTSSKRITRRQNSLRLENLESRQLLAADISLNFGEFATDRLLFQVDSNAALVSQSASHELSSLGRVSPLGMDGWFRLDLHRDSNWTNSLQSVSQAVGVVNVMPDYMLQIATTPNDPRYGELYGLENIDAPVAWDYGTTSSSVVVAVIDTGVDYNHPDLVDNIWGNADEIPGNGIDDDGNGFVDDLRGWDFANNDNNPFDDNGHGTHVAGTIGATGNNGVGITGVTWDVQIMPLKFLASNGSGFLSDAVEAVQYATANGADIINASFGGGGFNSMMQSAIRSFQEAGGIFVAAAGNESNNNDVTPSYPANYNLPSVVSVAASTATDTMASFSNFGTRTVDIAAPGSNILSTLPGNRYGRLSGTSMAAPHVAGAMALLWGQNPSLTNFELIDLVMSNTDELLLDRTTHGRLNVGKAAAALAGGGDPPVDEVFPFVEGVEWNSQQSGLDSITVDFSEEVTWNSNDFVVTGPGGRVAVRSIDRLTTDASVVRVTLERAVDPGLYTIEVLPTVADRAGNLLNQNGNAIGGETGDNVIAQFELEVPAVRNYSTVQPVALRDATFFRAGVTTATINVPDSMVIEDIDVDLSINHTWVGDLRVRLIAPNGQSVTLVNRRGGSTDNMRLTLDDQASARVRDASTLTGTFRPEQTLSQFRGLNAAGRWTLQIVDFAAFDTGVLNFATLKITAAASASSAGNSGASDGRAAVVSWLEEILRRRLRF